MCRFCDDLKDWKEIEQSNIVDFRLRISMRHFKRNGSGHSETTYGYYKIHYCPECGKELEKG